MDRGVGLNEVFYGLQGRKRTDPAHLRREQMRAEEQAESEENTQRFHAVTFALPPREGIQRDADSGVSV